MTTRNDDHGGNPLWRLQALIDTFDAQCRRCDLDAEVIVVEWNPPPDQKRLADVITLPAAAACQYRFIEVPLELHRTLAHSDALPLFQMIAKNVGIRRARGEFILATNIDVIFSNEIVDFIARRVLEAGYLYRVDRHDVESRIPIDQSVDARMEYCRSHQLRINGRWGTFPVDPGGRLRPEADDIVDGREVSLKGGWHVREGNAQGSFRWAMPEATILCDARTQASVLELEIEPNPYDPGASVDIDVVDGVNRALGAFKVEGRAVYRLPLASVPDEVSLRVAASSPGALNAHALLEARQPLAYVVRSIRLRRLADLTAEAHDYPRHLWRPATNGAVLQPGEHGDALDVTAPGGGYAVKCGPFRAGSAGAQRFVLEVEPCGSGLAFGVLSGDELKWLPSTTAEIRTPNRRATALTVTTRLGDRFWLVLSTPVAAGDGPVRFTVRRLSASMPADVVSDEAASSRRPDGSTHLLARVQRQVGAAAAKVATRLTSRWPGAVTRAFEDVRYDLVLASPEYQSLREAFSALQASSSVREQDLIQLARRWHELAPLSEVRDVYRLFRNHPPPNLHLNACGDFQLMARRNWIDLRGYPEIQAYSMNLDGLFSTLAFYAGVEERALKAPIYHLEHESGSGWTPEGEEKLRRRLDAKGIPWIDSRRVSELSAYMAHLGRPMIFNNASWGFGDDVLPEVSLPDSNQETR